MKAGLRHLWDAAGHPANGMNGGSCKPLVLAGNVRLYRMNECDDKLIAIIPLCTGVSKLITDIKSVLLYPELPEDGVDACLSSNIGNDVQLWGAINRKIPPSL